MRSWPALTLNGCYFSDQLLHNKLPQNLGTWRNYSIYLAHEYDIWGGLNEGSSFLFHLHQWGVSKVGGCTYLKAHSRGWSLTLAIGWDFGWGCGQNTHIWPFHVTAWLPQTPVAGFSGWKKRASQGKAVAFFDQGLKSFRAHFYLILFIRSESEGKRN